MNGISPHRIKLSQLRALVAVARYGNFSEAALQLEISQSAVSHAIATLEKELGVCLFARGRQGAYLTTTGEGVISYAQEVLKLLDGMVEEANSHKGLEGGRVRIAAFRSIATHVLPAIVAQFRCDFPLITVAITEYSDYRDIEQALREGRADIGFMEIIASEQFESWEIFRDDYVALLPPTAKLHSNQLNWQQLAAYPLIADVPGTGCHLKVYNYLQISDLPLKIAYEIKEDSTRVQMVAQGLGAAVLPRLAAHPIPTEVQVCRLPVPLERIIGATILADALLHPAVFAFLDMVKNNSSVVRSGSFSQS